LAFAAFVPVRSVSPGPWVTVSGFGAAAVADLLAVAVEPLVAVVAAVALPAVAADAMPAAPSRAPPASAPVTIHFLTGLTVLTGFSFGG